MKSDEAIKALEDAWTEYQTRPMARVVAQADAIAADKIRLSWPAEVINDLADCRRAELVAAALPLISTGQFDYQAQQAALETFAAGLESDIARERQLGGRLRPWQRADIRAAWAVPMNDMAWNGVEILLVIERLLPEGDDIVSVTTREITTSSGKVITRSDLRQFCPVNVWPSQFERSLTSEREIAALEANQRAKAELAAQPFRKTAGPTHEYDPN